MNSNLKDRFKELLLKLEIGQGKFEELCGMGNGTINNIKIGISSPNLEKIANAFPEINVMWLITGKGEMFIENQTLITNSPTSNKDIKILDIRVCAGHGIGLDGDENKITGYVNIPDFTGCYGVVVYGDSMYDMYMPGDTIFVRRVNDWKNIDNGQPYVIITNEDRLLKMIHVDYKNKKTVLSSYNNVCNPDGRRKYPDMEIDMDNDVKFLYKVVGKLARTQM